MKSLGIVLIMTLLSGFMPAAQVPDILIADFETETYGSWKATGDAFGTGPARGKIGGQMNVDGFLGKGLVNSFFKGDGSLGTLTSPPFKIERAYLRFLIGGGGFTNETCLNLRVNGKVVRTATGPNLKPGGSERLEPHCWDIRELLGQEAAIEIVDARKGGWGHINVDHIVQSDQPAPILKSDVTTEITAEKRLLNFPVKDGAIKRKVQIMRGGKVERFFDVELADATPDWWAPMDISNWKGQKLMIQVDKLPEDSRGMEQMIQSDDLVDGKNLYRESLRPQFHFSPQRGWNNDPNGLAFFNGEYHLFFQHNPFGWKWGNMHWGHAVSRDLVHWQELGDVLAPDGLGPMFSGSAVVDWNNTSGLGAPGKPPLVLIYTAAGKPTVQCIASSTDGRGFTKFPGNPVLREITSGNRDPKVMWHAATKKWVMVLYVGKEKQHTIHFFTSPNLKDWTLASVTEGGLDKDHFLFECPDFFELPVDGNAVNKKWVLMAANSEYALGQFDGTKFTPEQTRLKGHRGRGFYAAQTFSDIPIKDGRRIQIGWLQAPSPGMPFNQAMTIPLALNLISTAEGPRITWTPVKELESLRSKTHLFKAFTLKAADRNPLASIRTELPEIKADFVPEKNTVITFSIRGATIAYEAQSQELVVNGHRASAPLRNGRMSLTLYCDRTALEIFSSDGLTYVPLPFIPKENDLTLGLSVTGGTADFSSLTVYELNSAWSRR